MAVGAVGRFVNRQTTTPSLTDAGRELAAELADCYVEVGIEGRFSSKDECQEFAATHGFDLLATGLGRDIYRCRRTCRPPTGRASSRCPRG